MAVSALLVPAAGAAPADDATTAGLLEPTDPLIEDVVVPEIFAPLGDALAPLVDLAFGFFPGRFPVQPATTANDVLFDLLEPIQPSHFDFEVENITGNTVVQSGRGRPGIPSLVSVSNDMLPDLSIEVTDVATTPTVRIIRLPGAPRSLPVVVTVTVAPQGWASPVRYTITTNATNLVGQPDMAKVTVTELGPDPAFSVDTVNAGPYFSAEVTRSP